LIGLVAFVAIWVVFLFNTSDSDKASEASHFVGAKISNVNVLDGGGQSMTLYSALESPDAPYTLISMWATWCAPCIEELPLLEAREQYFKNNGVALMLMNYDIGTQDVPTRKKVTDWLNENRINLATNFDPAEGLLESLSVYALPYNVLLSKDGEILYVKNGLFEEDKIMAAIRNHGEMAKEN